MRSSIFLFFAFAMMPSVAHAWMWLLPAKVDAVFYLDRFGGCYCYNEIGLMYVSEKTKPQVMPHANRLVSVNVTGIYQTTIPGDIRMDHFTIDDPAPDAIPSRNKLQLDASLQNDNREKALKLCVTNRGDNTVVLYPGIINFLVITRKPDSDNELTALMNVSDGPSVPIGEERIFGWPQRTWVGKYGNDQEHLSWSVRDGKEIKDTANLLPGQSTTIMIDLHFTKGQYELFFGYNMLRDSSYETSMNINDLVLPVLSNGLTLDVDARGTISLGGGNTSHR